MPEHIPQLAGWVKGVPRLGVPDLVLNDAGLGVTNPLGARPGGYKWFLDAQIDPAAHRESDLLAVQIAIERAEPGALMCAYQKINGTMRAATNRS